MQEKVKFINFLLCYLPAIIMPGPSIALIIQSRVNCKVEAVLVSMGIVLGIAIQSGISILGVNFITNSSIMSSLRVMSAMFILYLGISTIRSVNFNKKHTLRCRSINFLSGLLIEILNPMPWIFFISFLSVTIQDLSFKELQLYWITIILCALIWFLTIALTPSEKLFMKFLNKKLTTLLFGMIYLFFGGVSLYMVVIRIIK